MRVAAVIPCLDEELALPRLLADLRGVDEVVVADGGSRDRSPALAEAAGARVIHARGGRGPQLDAGARASRAERLWFLHADSRVPPGALAALRSAATRWGCFEVRIDGRHPLLRSTEAVMNLRARLTGCCTGDMGMWMDRSLYERLGGFPPWPLLEDLGLGDAARAVEPWSVLRPALSTSARRWERAGVVRTMWKMWVVRAAWRMGREPASLVSFYRSEPR